MNKSLPEFIYEKGKQYLQFLPCSQVIDLHQHIGRFLFYSQTWTNKQK